MDHKGTTKCLHKEKNTQYREQIRYRTIKEENKYKNIIISELIWEYARRNIIIKH